MALGNVLGAITLGKATESTPPDTPTPPPPARAQDQATAADVLGNLMKAKTNKADELFKKMSNLI